MCEAKTILATLSILSLVAAIFSRNQAHTENNLGHHSEIKSQGPCKNEDNKFCLNGGKSCYLVNEDIVGCNYICFYGDKRYNRYMWWN